MKPVRISLVVLATAAGCAAGCTANPPQPSHAPVEATSRPPAHVQRAEELRARQREPELPSLSAAAELRYELSPFAPATSEHVFELSASYAPGPRAHTFSVVVIAAPDTDWLVEGGCGELSLLREDGATRAWRGGLGYEPHGEGLLRITVHPSSPESLAFFEGAKVLRGQLCEKPFALSEPQTSALGEFLRAAERKHAEHRLERALASLDDIPTTETPADGFDADAWGQWHDFDGDCHTTRDEWLERSSEAPVRYKDACTVRSGRWRCPYTGKTLTRAKDVSVTHVLPPKVRFGVLGHNPDADETKALERSDAAGDSLLVIAKKAQRRRAALPPANWVPKRKNARCGYVTAYAAALLGELTPSGWTGKAVLSEAEKTELLEQVSVCKAGGIPDAPKARRRR